MSWIENWKKQIADSGYKYFVLKVDHLLDSLDEQDVLTFNDMLETYNKYRETIGKEMSTYWVVNKEDVPHIKNWEDFAKCINYKKND